MRKLLKNEGRKLYLRNLYNFERYAGHIECSFRQYLQGDKEVMREVRQYDEINEFLY